MSQGKGSKSRITDLNRYKSNYDEIDWSQEDDLDAADKIKKAIKVAPKPWAAVEPDRNYIDQDHESFREVK